jgi:hypothetical protein
MLSSEYYHYTSAPVRRCIRSYTSMNALQQQDQAFEGKVDWKLIADRFSTSKLFMVVGVSRAHEPRLRHCTNPRRFLNVSFDEWWGEAYRSILTWSRLVRARSGARTEQT